ncbi:kelch repeat-containing protein [Massilia sp. 9I]|uniref:Kelch repeat-containing protein n=1 Tax=Massilia sp. 9I TaxID=2653152 RepID=UPI0012F3F0D7|nr:kelch repeat-containing protein [Massilia sp. 9I]VXB28537.1 exported hypothetical protein [Massilia sp. 9I]
MKRRDSLRALGALLFTATAAGCGGGGSTDAPGPAPAAPKIDAFVSDKASHFVGDSVSVTATFSGGAGRIEPGAIPVTSGVPLQLGPLKGDTTLRLVVTAGQAQVSRELALKLSYRERFTPVAMAFARGQHRSVELPNGKVLVLGGRDLGATYPVAVMSYDVQANTFSQAGTLLTGRVGHTATVLADGTVLIVGGARSLTGSPIAERFNPATGISRATATQPLHSRSLHSATLLADGRVLFIGGVSSAANAAASTADLFDPATDQFTRLPLTLARDRFGHAALPVTPNTVVIYGGATLANHAAQPELFDVSALATSTAALPAHDAAPRYGTAVVRTASGDFAVIGGVSPDDGTLYAKIALVAGGGIAFKDGGQLLQPRLSHAAAPLSDGRVLVAGGITTDGKASSSTELYAPVARNASAGPVMARARTEHTATTLSNGKVLVIGGLGDDDVPLASAELFE